MKGVVRCGEFRVVRLKGVKSLPMGRSADLVTWSAAMDDLSGAKPIPGFWNGRHSMLDEETVRP